MIPVDSAGVNAMGLILKQYQKGKLRPNWYGLYFDAEGRRRVVNLNIPWRGNPPGSLRVGDTGDATFEKTRDKALAALSVYKDEARRRGRAENLTERLIESKTGRQVEYVTIKELPAKWRSIGRESTPSARYLLVCDAQFQRFISFMQKHKPEAVFLHEVAPSDASEFIAQCRNLLAPSTARDTVRLLNKSFSLFLPVGSANPFDQMIRRRSKGDSGTIHRKPFTPDELRALLDEAKHDELMYPLIVCAAMTGLRRGDVCRLKWENIDFSSGMLSVRTSKTNAPTEIPIFPLLQKVLVEAGQKKRGYVWPHAAEMLEMNPDGLTWRFKKIVARVFAKDDEPLKNISDPATALRMGLAEIREHVSQPMRHDRMAATLQRYIDGASVRQIEKEAGVSRATISNDLRTIEVWTGLSIVRGRNNTTSLKQSIATLTRVSRPIGQRAASIHDWHCLRVTWITFALAAGVPMELVRRVTGHATVEVVLKHYFRPDREQFRTALVNAMPDLLALNDSSKSTLEDELVELAMKLKNGIATEEDRRRIRLLAAKA